MTLRWRGPDGGIAAVVAANPPSPVPTLIGPPGVAGPAGPEGPVAEIIDGGTFN
ncbi:MAG: hypothetical protein AB1408_07545 [Pseudomonadota bacterium]